MKAKKGRQVTADELLSEITEILAGTDPETILEVANSVFADRPWKRIADREGFVWFEQKTKED